MNSDDDPECPGAGRQCWVNRGSGRDPEAIGRSEEVLPCGQTSKVWDPAQSYLGSYPVPPHRAEISLCILTLLSLCSLALFYVNVGQGILT